MEEGPAGLARDGALMVPNIPSLEGFRPFLLKEVTEWWQRRAALITFLVTAALGVLGTLATRIDQWAGGTPVPADLDPTANVLGALFEQWVVFGAVFASMSLLIGERGSGTLAWTLSKPISRSAVLLAKWFAAVAMLAVFGIALPLVVAVVVATIAYGSSPDLGRIAMFGAVLVALPAFFVALNLAVSTQINSQAGLAGIALGVAGIPVLFGGLFPTLAELWPTSMMVVATTMGSGGAPHLPTVISWLVVVIGLAVVGLIAFEREDL